MPVLTKFLNMRNFIFNIALAALMLPLQVLAPPRSADVMSTNQKYETYSIEMSKREIYKEIKEITSNSENVIKTLDTSYILNNFENQKRLLKTAETLNVRPAWLLLVFYIETAGTLSTAIQNTHSNATGIIQWTPSTARYLGTSVEHIQNMSFVDQLNYVEKYISILSKRSNIITYEDLYLSVLYPGALGESDDFILGIKPSYNTDKKDMTFKESVYYMNEGVDKDKNGVLTVKDVKLFATNFS